MHYPITCEIYQCALCLSHSRRVTTWVTAITVHGAGLEGGVGPAVSPGTDINYFSVIKHHSFS